MNQNPEQLARDKIDAMLQQAGWAVQDVKKISLAEKLGVAIREFPTETGPADFILFVDRKPVGVMEAKKEDEGHRLLVGEDQSAGYAFSPLYKNMDGFVSVNEKLRWLRWLRINLISYLNFLNQFSLKNKTCRVAVQNGLPIVSRSASSLIARAR